MAVILATVTSAQPEMKFLVNARTLTNCLLASAFKATSLGVSGAECAHARRQSPAVSQS